MEQNCVFSAAVRNQARQEVEAVCANSSLSMQQKRLQIQQIYQQERQQIDAVITLAQQAALRSCREQRNGGHSGADMSEADPAARCRWGTSIPQPEDETPPNDTAKPN
jgi:protein-tyrosine-phosphatase